MRDLAQQNYPSGKIAIPQSVVRIIALLVGVLVVLFLIKQFVGGGGLVGGSSLVLKDAPKGLTPVAVPDTSIDSAGVTNVSIESAAFTNVSEQSGSATATRTYGDGSFVMTVNATLPEVSGDRYQVWIIGGAAPKLAGTLQGSGTSLGLTFRDVDNYSALNTVWITREITPNDEKPEKNILEGSF